ncbi:MAG TPA: diphosphomevalonate decarboxylase [Anaerolineaceae bacterium]|nr:diphosphomevalonate decarboxylase [Anaerolineaceae bacterium]
MTENTATAIAHPNIAFIKYWGNRDAALRLPANGSISMNLAGLFTRTTVTFSPDIPEDTLLINQQPAQPEELQRVQIILNLFRYITGAKLAARVVTENNFPIGAGIASSASAFAALTLATSTALNLGLSTEQLSCLARRGSGSAARSIPAGFVEWLAGEDDRSSFARSLAPAEHWDLVDCITIVSAGHKAVGSTAGHALAETSPLQAARVADAPRRLDLCRQAIVERDFEKLAAVVEQDSNLMHAVMLTSTPSLLYWEPATVRLMQAVQQMRANGLPVCYTIDAGPNVHVLTTADARPKVEVELDQIPGVKKILFATPGGGVTLA